MKTYEELNRTLAARERDIASLTTLVGLKEERIKELEAENSRLRHEIAAAKQQEQMMAFHHSDGRRPIPRSLRNE